MIYFVFSRGLADLVGYAETVFTCFDRRDIFRAAVLLWITPFLAALSMVDFAVLSSFNASSFDFSFTASRTFLTMFFTLVFTDLFLRRLFSFWRARFIADLWFANVINPFQMFYR